MGLFDAFQPHYDEVNSSTHHGSITHDALAGAVAYEALGAYEKHCAANGKPSSHAEAKKIAAGLAAAAFTQLVETKGLNAWDAHKRAQAEKKVTENIDTVIVQSDYQ